MDKNIAFFGYALVTYAVFNLLFFVRYFKNTHKIGRPIVFGLIGYFLSAIKFKLVVGLIPSINVVLDTLNPAMIPLQIIFFICCVIVYIALMLGVYKLSTK